MFVKVRPICCSSKSTEGKTYQQKKLWILRDPRQLKFYLAGRYCHQKPSVKLFRDPTSFYLMAIPADKERDYFLLNLFSKEVTYIISTHMPLLRTQPCGHT